MERKRAVGSGDWKERTGRGSVGLLSIMGVLER